MQYFDDSKSLLNSNSNSGDMAMEQLAIERNMVFIVRRALREKCADSMLHRRILTEARRAGFDGATGSFAGEELIRTVARRLSANLVLGLRSPATRSRNVEETIRGS